MYQKLRLNIRFCDCLISYITKNEDKSKILFANRYVLNKSNFFKNIFENINPIATIIDKSVYNSYEINFPFSEFSLQRSIDLLYGLGIEKFDDIVDLLEAFFFLQLDDKYVKRILIGFIESSLEIEVLYCTIVNICKSNINNQIKTNFLSRILHKLTESQIGEIKICYSNIFPQRYFLGKTFVNGSKVILSNPSSIEHNGIKYLTYSTTAIDDKTERGIWLTAFPTDKTNEPTYNFKNIKITLFKELEQPKDRKIKSYDFGELDLEKDGKFKIPCPLKFQLVSKEFQLVSKERYRYGCTFYMDDGYDDEFDYEIEISD